MISISIFIQGVFGVFKAVSKKHYRTCAIILSGMMIVAIVSVSSEAFAKGGNSHLLLAKETIDTEEEVEKEEIVLFAGATDSVVSESDVIEPGSIIYTKDGEIIANNLGLTITKREYNALLKIVEAEAGNQDAIGRILIANVVINRVRSHRQPNDIEAVILAKAGNVYQFSPTKPNGRYYTVTPSDETKEAVKRALSGEDYSQGALYFAKKQSKNSWFNTSLEFVLQHDVHYFYKPYN